MMGAWMAEKPCDYEGGQRLRFTHGGHRGTEVTVDGGRSFWDHQTRTWEIVLNLATDDPKTDGLYFIRANEREVARWTEVIG